MAFSSVFYLVCEMLKYKHKNMVHYNQIFNFWYPKNLRTIKYFPLNKVK